MHTAVPLTMAPVGAVVTYFTMHMLCLFQNEILTMANGVDPRIRVVRLPQFTETAEDYRTISPPLNNNTDDAADPISNYFPIPQAVASILRNFEGFYVHTTGSPVYFSDRVLLNNISFVRASCVDACPERVLGDFAVNTEHADKRVAIIMSSKYVSMNMR